MERLRTVNPLSPVRPQPDSALMGAWTLTYASMGGGDLTDGGMPTRPRSDSAPLSNLLAQVSEATEPP